MYGMKTTIQIPDPLFRAAKRKALDEGMTLTQLITRALAAEVSPSHREAFKFNPDAFTFKGKPGLQPGVDFSNWEQIRALCYGDRE